MAELDGIVGMLKRQREQMEEDRKRFEAEHRSADEFLDKLRELRDRAAALERPQKPESPNAS